MREAATVWYTEETEERQNLINWKICIYVINMNISENCYLFKRNNYTKKYEMLMLSY